MAEARRAVVTGAGQGVGRAIALELGKHGTDIVLVGRRRDKLDAVHKELEALGSRSSVLSVDLTSRDAANQVRDSLDGGKLDILVNCAASLGSKAVRGHIGRRARRRH